MSWLDLVVSCPYSLVCFFMEHPYNHARYHNILYQRPLHPVALLLPLHCQMKCIYGTCAGKTVSRRRPSNFIFEMPAINLSNGLNRIGVARGAIRHGLSLRGLWAYLSQPKTSAGRRKRKSVETGGGFWWEGKDWSNMLSTKCVRIPFSIVMYMQTHAFWVGMKMCAQRSTLILEHPGASRWILS